jgi:hypothetical protein
MQSQRTRWKKASRGWGKLTHLNDINKPVVIYTAVALLMQLMNVMKWSNYSYLH